jgi:hypothetical protein
MNDDQAKLNLPSIQYFELVGDDDQLITYLNCIQSCVYNIFKTERNCPDEDLYEIFLGELTFGLIEDTAGSVYDIAFLDGTIHPLGFKMHYTLGKGIEVLPKVEALLDQGKAVIVQTYMQRVPYFINFVGFDYKFDEAYYRQNYQLNHTFVVLGYDQDHLYYLDTPYVHHKERYIPYQNNKTIGVLQKRELIPAFNAFFNYTFLTFDEAQPLDRIDIVKTVAAKSFQNYHLQSGDSDGKLYFYGKAALNRLNHHFQKGTMSFDQPINQYHIKLDQLLIWKFQFVMNRRYILARTLEKYTGRLNSSDIGGLIELLNNSIKSWRILISKMKKMQARKETKFGTEIQELFGKISVLEDKIIDRLKALA